MKPQTEPSAGESVDDGGRIADLQALIDERDETIRLLNEALSRALDELALLDDAA
jgi:hypothetical protein